MGISLTKATLRGIILAAGKQRTFEPSILACVSTLCLFLVVYILYCTSIYQRLYCYGNGRRGNMRLTESQPIQ